MTLARDAIACSLDRHYTPCMTFEFVYHFIINMRCAERIKVSSYHRAARYMNSSYKGVLDFQQENTCFYSRFGI